MLQLFQKFISISKAGYTPFDTFETMRTVWFLVLLVACNTTDKSDAGGKVVGIADGDTFTMLANSNQQVKVRLYGIDCPEKAQDFGSVARQKLSDLVFGKQVRLDVQDTDRYGRTVAIVYNKGLNVNEELLRSGLAWHYTEYDKNPAWDDLMLQAQRQKRGLWAQPNPTPPWNWRKRKRQGAD